MDPKKRPFERWEKQCSVGPVLALSRQHDIRQEWWFKPRVSIKSHRLVLHGIIDETDHGTPLATPRTSPTDEVNATSLPVRIDIIDHKRIRISPLHPSPASPLRIFA